MRIIYDFTKAEMYRKKTGLSYKHPHEDVIDLGAKNITANRYTPDYEEMDIELPEKGIFTCPEYITIILAGT